MMREHILGLALVPGTIGELDAEPLEMGAVGRVLALIERLQRRQVAAADADDAPAAALAPPVLEPLDEPLAAAEAEAVERPPAFAWLFAARVVLGETIDRADEVIGHDLRGQDDGAPADDVVARAQRLEALAGPNTLLAREIGAEVERGGGVPDAALAIGGAVIELGRVEDRRILGAVALVFAPDLGEREIVLGHETVRGSGGAEALGLVGLAFGQRQQLLDARQDAVAIFGLGHVLLHVL